ncbi:MAG TPA: glycoside hydrolase family 3 N-terminal domain-containing protein [Acidobacteriaceae bacterium]|nr:glycoside hydrolase family 3 N-terminal domain-containing protein [Acidobacteriaceae bacterium]
MPPLRAISSAPAFSGSSGLRRAAGAVIIAGLEGTSLSAVETAWLKLIRPSGVILFRRNVEEAAQTHALLKAAIAAVDGPLFRCIDVEGGTVDRLRDLTAPMPSAAAVGATRNPLLFREHGRLIGQEIRMLGLNTTFAPVLDLRTDWSEPVMTTRVVSGDPVEVTRYAGEFLKALAHAGVLGCGKHFPGLGSGSVDSHHSTPRIARPFDLLWKEDLLPYRRLARRLPFVMISHAGYPLTEGGEEPASVSRFWTTEVLVEQIGFQGLIVSDDMEMGGILTQTSLADAVVRAVLAGTHLIEICRDPALVLTAFETLLSEAERSPAFARRLRQSAASIESFERRRLKADRFPAPPDAGAVAQAREETRRFTAKIDRLGSGKEMPA